MRFLHLLILTAGLAGCSQTQGSADRALPACHSHCTANIIVINPNQKRGENSPPITTDMKIPLIP